MARYSEEDSIGKFEWVNFRKHGGVEATRAARPKMFYPIFAKDNKARLPEIEWNITTNSWVLLESPLGGEEIIIPVTEAGNELRWKWGVESFSREITHFISRPDQSGRTCVHIKSRMSSKGMLPVTTNLLTKLFGGNCRFFFSESTTACC